ncbi:potassium/proton antiporter [Nitratireductor aquimarinus]|uniref:potassium/proton antiporter n=1 Tax=Alphaproteobacteria TaxID=28211 RepID=UPI000DDFF0EE|nr:MULTISPECIES: potassium/proton antiporter [Alphaproteobacteria]MBY6021929.1 potassium/proton antiporter [Nitratireductor sp. DP7N14-4]MBN7757142.1 potassium/proton antiporter [Nitratireductor aquimarinus]MBN7761084.1 potassium/proton antiporter [Nitratireductor aquibiodomus]MBN7777320.1 potassium/proton antiporter [Nitratireductor pacificus]MBN7780991.1 potassium/proton antiporter [Nitratireductor pacificus]
MDQGIYVITLVGTALVLFAAFSSLIAFRFGAPLLLIFLGIGLAAGTDGLGLDFDNAAVAYFIGSLALAVILFDSGFGTSVAAFRQAAAPALVLATIGVLMTAGLVGVAAYYVTGFGWLESLLLGATVASTDAAAVFFLLRVGNISVRERVRSTLEVESGSNDPIAIFLTLSLVGLIASGEAMQADTLAADVAIGFLQQMGIGLMAGLVGGWSIVRLVVKLKLEQGLLPIFVLALSLLVFALAGAMGGSGFLAVYVAGLIAGNAKLRSTAMLKRFQDGVTWLAQIIMFLVLGLFATPSQFADIILPALFIGLFLIFVARPLAVTLCLAPFRFSPAESAFVSWVGLRGAVSILLAITPLIDELPNGRALFNIVFIIVLVSLIVQGWTVGPLARRLGLTLPPRMGPLNKVELELPGSARHELLAYRVVAGSPVERGQRIPRWAKPSLVVRDGRSMTYQYAGRLSAGDHVYIFVPDRYPRLLDRLFASPVEMDPEDADFFGAFSVDPERPASDIEAAYAPGLSEDEQKKTIAELMRERLGGRAEYGDRATLGEIELIVRDVDEDGRVIAAGLSVEPQAPEVRVPLLLSPRDLMRRIFRRKPRPDAGS